jgi:hypothetical protein
MYANAQNSIIWLKSCEPPGPPSPPFSHCLAVSRAKVPLDPQSTFRRKRWHKPLTPSTGDPAAMEDWCWKWLESGGRSRLLVVGMELVEVGQLLLWTGTRWLSEQYTVTMRLVFYSSLLNGRVGLCTIAICHQPRGNDVQGRCLCLNIQWCFGL